MRFAIFNGFGFHYETFGVFLHYIKSNSHDVTIFSENTYESGWFNFYRKLYGDWLVVRHSNEFNENHFQSHDFVIITTDDDWHFLDAWMFLPDARNKVLCYDHYKGLRREIVAHHVGTRPFITGGRPNLPYVIPCYPLFTKEQKREALATESTINVTLIGGIDNIDRYIGFLKKSNDLSRVKFTFVRRWIDDARRKVLESLGVNYELIVYMETAPMFELLKRTHYTLFTDDAEHTFNSSSGQIGLSLTTGCTMLMPKLYNTDYKFKSALCFEDEPELKHMPDLDSVFSEQAEILQRNAQNLDDFVHKRGYYA